MSMSASGIGRPFRYPENVNMARFPDLPTLADSHARLLQSSCYQRSDPLAHSTLQVEKTTLKAPEWNRFYSLYSTQTGAIPRDESKSHHLNLEALPPRPPSRMDSSEEPPTDPSTVPRSRLVDQFYSHELPGASQSAMSGVRGFIRRQRQLAGEVHASADLMRHAMKQLMIAYPNVSRQGLCREFTQSAAEGQPQLVFEGIKCPTRYMESSIAVVLEHTERLTMNIGTPNGRDEQTVTPPLSPPLEAPAADPET
jgi:hypothetical protein